MDVSVREAVHSQSTLVDGREIVDDIKIVRPRPGLVTVFWPSEEGRVYEIEASAEFDGPYRIVLSDVHATPSRNTEIFIEDSSVPNYFRVLIVPRL